MSEAPDLETVIQQVKSGNKEALEYLYNFAQQPESLGIYFQCFQSTRDKYVRRFVLSQIRRFYTINSESIPPDFHQALFAQLTAMIPEETEILARDDMCDLLSFIPDAQQQILEYAWKLIQSQQPNLICAAFAIISDSFAHFDDERENVINTFSPVAIQLLVGSDPLCRQYAYQLFFTFLSDNLDFELLQSNADFEGAIQYHLSNLTPALDPNEINNVFKLIDLVIKNAFPLFLENIQAFTEFLTAFLVNPEFPLEVRMNASTQITSLFEIAPELIHELLPLLLTNYIQLAVEISTADPDSEDYQILTEPIKNMEDEEIFDFFMSAIQNLMGSGELMAIRIAFYVMSLILDISYEKTLANLDTIIHMCLEALENSGATAEDGHFEINNSYIPDAVAQVIYNLYSSFSEELQEYHQPLLDALFNFIEIVGCCNAIASILQNRMVQDNLPYIQRLIQLIKAVLSQPEWSFSDVELLFEMLVSFLESITEINEPIFIELNEIIQPFMSLGTPFKLVAFKCFSAMIPICPQSTSGLIDAFIQAGFALIDPSDSEINATVLYFFDIVVQNQAQFIIPYIPQVIEFVTNIFKLDKNEVTSAKVQQIAEQEEEDTDELENQQEQVFSDMTQRAILILLNICELNPESCSEFLESIYQNLCELMNNNNELIARTAVQSFGQLADIYVRLNLDTAPILDALLHQLDIPNPPSLDYIAKIWSAMGVVMGTVGRALIFPKAEDIYLRLSQVFIDQEKNSKFNDKGNQNEISKIFRDPVFQVLDTIIDELGADFLPHAEPFVQNLMQIITQTSSLTHAYCARSLVHIAALFPHEDANGNQILANVFPIIMNCLQSPISRIKTIGLSTLVFLINQGPDVAAESRGDLVQYCFNIIEKVEAGSQEETSSFVNECVSLYFTLIQQYQMIGTVDTFVNPVTITKAVFICDPDYDNPVLVSYAKFAQFIISIDATFQPHFMSLVVTALGSSHSILRQIPPEVLAFLADMISTVAENDLQKLLRFNMTKVNAVNNTIAQIKGSSS